MRLGVQDHHSVDSGLYTGILFRPDIDFARVLAGTASDESEELFWSGYGVCAVPTGDVYVSGIYLPPSFVSA